LAKTSDALDELAGQYWEARLANEPIFATVLGDRRYDSLLPDVTREGRERMLSQYTEVMQRCKAIHEDGLSEKEKLTLNALVCDVQAQIDYASCGLEEWAVDPLGGPQVELLNLESLQTVRSPEEGRAMVERWRRIGPFLDDHVANLRRGIEVGKVAVRVCVEKVLDETRDLLAKPDVEWSLLRPLAVHHEGWSSTELQEFNEGLRGAVRESARPGFERYLRSLESEVLPRARLQGRAGIVNVPGGGEAYKRLIRVHTSLDLTPQALHQTGLSEVARINQETEDLGEKVFGTRDRKEILHRLRTDMSLYFSSRDEVAEKAEGALAKAKSAIVNWFGRLPRADCEVVRMEEYEEKHSTIAYYRQPASDGSRPGRYYINTSSPETRPRYEAEALAYHESIPGHHLQIAIAQELEGIPEFRKNSGTTAFIEGWGLYSERLAGEMGLYSSDFDRMGVLSYDAWRACRLVVDTGMHAMGWSRDAAIDFMLENTALAKNNIVNEVDRYITWPGQALAYKTGQLEMTRLRALAEAAMGERFDVKRFHDALLGNGALPLGALKQTMEGFTRS
jgi:uncharacterized protein (DUF885 family)